MEERRCISSLIFKSGETVEVPYDELLFNERSKFHIIQIARTDLGLTLFINGIIQAAEGDNGAYERCMIRPLRSYDEEILIIGGGDGKLAYMVHIMNPLANITVVDIDEKIVEVCQQFFGQTVFSNSNSKVKLSICDALRFLKNRDLSSCPKFDGVLVDLTDDPIRKDDENFESFHSKLIELIHQNLAQDGWVSVQAGTEEVCDSFLDSKLVLKTILSGLFNLVQSDSTQMPSFEPDRAAFLYGLEPKICE